MSYAKNLINLGTSQLAKSLAEIVQGHQEEVPLAFLSTITSSEMLVRGCLLHHEIINAAEISDTRFIQLLQGSPTVSFSFIPKMISTILGHPLQDTAPHRRMMQVRKRLLKNGDLSIGFEEVTLRFAFEIIDPFLFEYLNGAILMHLPETLGDFDEVIDKRFSALTNTKLAI